MAVTIEQIKELRAATGVSMMFCKKALEEVGGDYDKAVDYLRKKGEAKAVDRSAREISEGVIAVKFEGGKAAMVQLGCETDFVARGDDFIALVNGLAEKLYNGKINVDEKELSEVKDAVLKLGENIQVSGMVIVEGEVLGVYVHSNNKIGVIVSLDGGNEALAKDIAMHVAATNPEVISPEEIPRKLVDKEKEIWSEQLKNEGKPEEIIEKIMVGKEKKFREENALIKQAFVKDSQKTVEQLLSEKQAQVKEFKRFAF